MNKTSLFSVSKDDQCPQCHQGVLVIRHGTHGPFKGCSRYPDCGYILSLQQSGHILAVLDEQPCPQCGNALVIRQGKYGPFIGCSEFPECDYIQNLEKPDDTQALCPQCQQGHLLQRRSRQGKIFYACENYPRCQFAVNYPPLAKDCPTCGYPLLIKQRAGWVCANKSCSKKVPEGYES